MQNQYLHILGLQPGATKSQIKAAYRKLAKIYHPDVSHEANARKQFIEINEAYSFLIDADPKPNHQALNYDFDPHTKTYDVMRERARAYARQKAEEAEEYHRSAIAQVNRYGKIPVFLALVLASVITIDYLLPTNARNEQILKIESVVETFTGQVSSERKILYYLVTLNNYSLRINENEVRSLTLRTSDAAQVRASPILGHLRDVTITQDAGVFVITPGLSTYILDLILVPAAFILGFFYFKLESFDHNRITIAILLLLVAVLEVVAMV